MSTVKNETTNSTNSQEISRSVFDHAGSAIEVSSAVKDLVKGLNSSAAEIVSSELKARQVTYEYVAKLCDAAHRMGSDEEFLLAVQSITDKLFGVTDKNSQKGQALRQPNPFLNLVRIADGEWDAEYNKRTGGKTVRWKPNRSGEKYAGVCRFAVRNGYSGAKMLEHFMSGESFIIPGPTKEEDKEVKATINAIIAEDRKQHNGEQREVLNDDDWDAITRLPPVVTIPLTKRVLSSLTLSEGGLVIIAGRVAGGTLYLFGDAGIDDGHPVHRQFKKHKDKMFSKGQQAVRETDEPAVLPEEYHRREEAEAELEFEVGA